METIKREYTVYKFSELSEDAKDKAIEKLYDINVDYDWWDSLEDDALQIGLKITESDIDRGSFVKGYLTMDALDVANNIINNHGESCGTYKTAKVYLEEYGNLSEDDYGDKDTEEIDEDFEYALLQEYLSMLVNGYEYLTSREAIIETIEANDYSFTDDGKIFS